LAVNHRPSGHIPAIVPTEEKGPMAVTEWPEPISPASTLAI
jgi:hypothetical protein